MGSTRGCQEALPVNVHSNSYSKYYMVDGVELALSSTK